MEETWVSFPVGRAEPPRGQDLDAAGVDRYGLFRVAGHDRRRTESPTSKIRTVNRKKASFEPLHEAGLATVTTQDAMCVIC